MAAKSSSSSADPFPTGTQIRIRYKERSIVPGATKCGYTQLLKEEEDSLLTVYSFELEGVDGIWKIFHHEARDKCLLAEDTKAKRLSDNCFVVSSPLRSVSFESFFQIRAVESQPGQYHIVTYQQTLLSRGKRSHSVYHISAAKSKPEKVQWRVEIVGTGAPIHELRFEGPLQHSKPSLGRSPADRLYRLCKHSNYLCGPNLVVRFALQESALVVTGSHGFSGLFAKALAGPVRMMIDPSSAAIDLIDLVS